VWPHRAPAAQALQHPVTATNSLRDRDRSSPRAPASLEGTLDAAGPVMIHLLRAHVLAAACTATAVLGCATTSTTSTTWTAADARGQTGTVESVQEIVQRVQGDPAAGAIAGALIGGFLFRGRGPARLFGAAAGAAIGASASQGYAEARSYHVLVQFDDGSRGMFVYSQFSPFRPGDPVVLTPHGLAHP
jgi:outer membrane lipoprotein SlyB